MVSPNTSRELAFGACVFLYGKLLGRHSLKRFGRRTGGVTLRSSGFPEADLYIASMDFVSSDLHDQLQGMDHTETHTVESASMRMPALKLLPHKDSLPSIDGS